MLNIKEILTWNIVTRQIKTRIILFSSICFALFICFILPKWIVSHNITRFIVSWDSWAFLYLFLILIVILKSTYEKIKSRAQAEDEWQYLILFLVIIAAIVSLLSIILELALVKNFVWFSKYIHLALVIFTIIVSWFFIHTMFALHYAHNYYARIFKWKTWGLEFAGTKLPTYSDFIYFAYIIGTSGQTADVSFSSQHLRRVWTMHCVLAFFFNTTVLALTINIASGLI
jgi:uncharacterized membrane protein